MKKTNQGLVIGRFQLAGNHHTDLFDQIEAYHREKNPLDILNVGIGIADVVDARNPFSGTECLEMIKPIAENTAKDIGVKVRYRLINDINDQANYAAHVSDIFGFKSENDDVKIFSSNTYTTDCFIGREGYDVVNIEERIKQHSTELRKLYLSGHDISDLVPAHIPNFLEKHNAKRRLEKLKYDNPILTVDVVIAYKGGIVLIERGDSLGDALPGGHVDLGETTENATIREAKEETNLDIVVTGLIGVFSEPKRDPRGTQRISVAYMAKGYGELKAKTDAKNAYVADESCIPKLAFDHNKIVDYALTKQVYLGG